VQRERVERVLGSNAKGFEERGRDDTFNVSYRVNRDENFWRRLFLNSIQLGLQYLSIYRATKTINMETYHN
jgi:hypothetical protein